VGGPVGELIAKRFGKWIHVYSGLDARPLYCFLYWEWLQVFEIPIKEGMKKKIRVEETGYPPRE
jgi:hypothetical protein